MKHRKLTKEEKLGMPATVKMLARAFKRIAKIDPDAVIMIEGEIVSQGSFAYTTGKLVVLAFIPIKMQVRCPWCNEVVPTDQPLHDCQQGE